LLKVVDETCDRSNVVLICHQTLEGGKTGESEFKPFMPDAVSLNNFEGYPLVMVGHLHAHQKLGNTVYSGSLLPYAFGDDYDAGISIWSDDSGTWTHQREPLDILHPLKTITGGLAHCLAQEASECYVKVKLTDNAYIDDALPKLQDRFPLLMSVITDATDTWEADLDKPIGTFSSVPEALTAFCEHLEIPEFTGRRKELIQEALDAYTKTKN
jgi:exonuclease SbcD